MSSTRQRSEVTEEPLEDEIDQGLPPLTPVWWTLRYIRDGEEEEPAGPILDFAEDQRLILELWARNADLVGASEEAERFRGEAAQIAAAMKKHLERCVMEVPEGADA